MGLLRDEAATTTWTIPARCVLGRSSTCTIQLNNPRVSGEHARLAWTRGGWELRDLGSRNGTWIDGQRLRPGEAVLLSLGTRVGFADPEGGYVLEEAGAPVAMARPLEGGAIVSAEAGLLVLPGAEDPRLTVFEDAIGRWVAELDGEPRQVADGQVLVLDEQSWMLHLPTAEDHTLDVGESPMVLDALELSFEVSADEEHVELEVRQNGRTSRLKSRAHHYLLLTLARARIEDAEGGEISVSEQGWLYADQLAESLRVDDARLNVMIFRARKEFAALGVSGAASIVERRRGSRKLRIGVAGLLVAAL
jgi:hypothetical protein